MNDPRVGSPFPGLTFAGELDDLQTLPMEVTMTEDWKGWLNGKVLNEAKTIYGGSLTHFRFLPDVGAGQVVLVPARDEKEYGAVAVQYSPTMNGAEVNLRWALKRFPYKWPKERVYAFPVVTRTAPNQRQYLALVVKDPAARPARKRSASPAAPAGEAAAGKRQLSENGD